MKLSKSKLRMLATAVNGKVINDDPSYLAVTAGSGEIQLFVTGEAWFVGRVTEFELDVPQTGMTGLIDWLLATSEKFEER